jgi:hypothetical protein
MAKKSKKTPRGRKTPKTRTPKEVVDTTPAQDNVAARLEELADNLASASQEAGEIAQVVRNDLAHELIDHRVDDAATKKSDGD